MVPWLIRHPLDVGVRHRQTFEGYPKVGRSSVIVPWDLALIPIHSARRMSILLAHHELRLLLAIIRV
jgi:hypothetical protein